MGTHGVSLSADVVDTLRSRMKASSYTGPYGGRSIFTMFSQFDKNGSGQLEVDEVRRALRRVLRIPSDVVPDAEIASLCTILDSNGSGSVRINDIVAFIS